MRQIDAIPEKRYQNNCSSKPCEKTFLLRTWSASQQETRNHKNTIPKQLLKFWIYFYKKEKIHISANTIIYTFQNLILEIIFNTNSKFVKIPAIIFNFTWTEKKKKINPIIHKRELIRSNKKNNSRRLTRQNHGQDPRKPFTRAKQIHPYVNTALNDWGRWHNEDALPTERQRKRREEGGAIGRHRSAPAAPCLGSVEAPASLPPSPFRLPLSAPLSREDTEWKGRRRRGESRESPPPVFASCTR